MSDQPNISTQGVQSPEELRQRIFDQIHAGKKVIEELSDEELEIVAGAGLSAVTLLRNVSEETIRASEGTLKASGGSNIKSYAISLAGGLFGPSLTSLTGR